MIAVFWGARKPRRPSSTQPARRPRAKRARGAGLAQFPWHSDTLLPSWWGNRPSRFLGECRSRSQSLDQSQNLPEQFLLHRGLGHLKCNVAAVVMRASVPVITSSDAASRNFE